jgi:dienelactone hydrolase
MVTSRRFELRVGAETIPGLMWFEPPLDGPRPTVLMAHGRGSDKHDPFLEPAARRFADRGYLVVLLDAPGHGERRSLPVGQPPPKPDARQSSVEWRSCLDHLVAGGLSDPKAIAYWGFSMGAGLGFAFLADDARVRCAAVGLIHHRYYPELLADASKVTCSLFFSMHWHDSRVPRNEAFELFDALGAVDKRLHAYPGDHGDFAIEELLAAESFIASKLDTADDVGASGERPVRGSAVGTPRTWDVRPTSR